MTASFRTLLAASLLALPLLLSGCIMDSFRTVIPDFESSEVLGVNVYRRVDNTGDPDLDWERASRLVFTEPFVGEDGVERMDYTVERGGGSEDFTATVVRDDQNPDKVTLGLVFYVEAEEAEVRIATYNAAGESLPSEETLTL